jgi:transposase
MPWAPHYHEQQARAAIGGAASWREVLASLGYAYHGKNIETVRRWAGRWNIPLDHLSDHRGRPHRARAMLPDDLREAVAASRSWAETLRRLGYCPSGANWKTLKRRVSDLGIPTDHFDPFASSRERSRRERTPLPEILVNGSTYNRTSLKRRLYEEGVKEQRCEMCGQDELWHGERMGLILDHVNGKRDDNRLENLRIVCPNCAATLATHCGRKNRRAAAAIACLRCGDEFIPRAPTQRYCSRECGTRWDRTGVKLRPPRKVARPEHADLLRQVRESGYLAVGRRYGVSDNAVRKWLREYERELAISEGRDPGAVTIPTRTWPRRRREAA